MLFHFRSVEFLLEMFDFNFLTCPLFKKWSKYKKNAHDVKIPLRLDSMEFEQVSDSNPSHFEINHCIRRVEKELKSELSEENFGPKTCFNVLL